MIRDVLKMGDPRLLETSRPIAQFGTSELAALVNDLLDTMQHLNGAGLAAPQIGVSLRVVVFGFKFNSRYPDAGEVPETVLINPILTPLGLEQDSGWEGCLSVPGLRGEVSRWTRLRYEGFDANGNGICRDVSDFHARVVQHECDHLDGILYPTRIRNLQRFGFVDELSPDHVAGGE